MDILRKYIRLAISEASKNKRFKHAGSYPEETYEKATIENLYLDKEIKALPSTHNRVNGKDVPVNKQIADWLKSMGMLEESVGIFGTGFENFKSAVDSGEDPVKAAHAAGYNKIGEGLTREVYQHPSGPEEVLKIAKAGQNFDLAKKTNSQEASNSMTTRHDIFPKVFERGLDGLWILSEKVSVLESIEDIAEFFPGVDITKSRFIFPVLLQLGVDSLVAGNEEFQKKMERLEASPQGKTVADMLNIAMSNQTFIQLVDVIAEYDIEPIEIKPGNVGVVTRDSSHKLVILDVSTGLHDKHDQSL